MLSREGLYSNHLYKCLFALFLFCRFHIEHKNLFALQDCCFATLSLPGIAKYILRTDNKSFKYFLFLFATGTLSVLRSDPGHFRGFAMSCFIF